MTSSNGNIFHVTGHLCGEFTGTRWIPRTKASDALMFSLICVWINDWVNNREAGDLRRYHTHCDVIVMFWQDTNRQNHGLKRLHVRAFCPKQYWAFCHACIFFPSEQTHKCWYLPAKWNIKWIKETNIIQCKIIANSNISDIKPSNRPTSMTQILHEIGSKFSKTWLVGN